MPSYGNPHSQSRIPVRTAPPPAHHVRSPSMPSRLEQLQLDYQARLNREKELRLQAIFDRQQEQQERAYNRIVRNSSAESGSSSVRSRGSVRDFFKQRRLQNETDTPPNSGRPPMPPYKRNSAGRDKSNPLAPIQRPHNYSNNVGLQNDHHNRRKRPTSRERIFSAGSDYSSTAFSPQPPKTKREAQHPRRPNPKYKYPANQFGHGTVDRQEKTSDFQKWQQEQDEAKERRLQNYRNNRNRDEEENLDQSWGRQRQDKRTKPAPKRPLRKPAYRQPSTEDDGDDDYDDETDTARKRRQSHEIEKDLIRQKEKEIEAMLMQQKAELVDLKRQRALEEQRHADALKRKQRIEAERAKLQRRPSFQKQSSFGSQADQSDDELTTPAPPVFSARSNRSSPAATRRVKPTPRPRQESPPPSPKPVTKREKPKPKPAKKPRPSQLPERASPEEELPPPSNANAYLEILDGAPDAAPQNVNLRPCPVCGRKFALERLEKHRTACEKSKNKKPRKVFDMTKMRTQGTEAAQYVKNRPKTPEFKKKKGNWRQKHEDFMNSLRYAKQVTAVQNAGGNIADLPPPPPSQNPDYVECPTCGRRFNETAAERHIPKCKNIKSKPKPLRR